MMVRAERWLRGWRILCLGFLLSAAAVLAPDADATDVLAPDWQLDSTSGRTVDFYRENSHAPSVLLFWASWCPYCKALYPELARLYQQFAGAGVSFFALNVWDDSDGEAYFRQQSLPFELILAADLVAEEYGLQGTPGVYVVDRQHRVVYSRKRGESPAEVATAAGLALKRALVNAPPAKK